MKTKKLYYNDSYQIKFTARVIDKYRANGRYALVLDQSCFYPTGGGQICDKGEINEVTVSNVEEDEGGIIHYLEKEISAKIDDIVTGKIDWQYRFDHMQQHTGQHILSGALIKLCQKDTESFHMGKEISTVLISASGVNEQKLKQVENLSNQIIYENRIIRQYYLENDGKLPTRESVRNKQGKYSEQLRIVEIEDFDRSFCGGTHCAKTGEVGMIKIIGCERRKDKLRISFLCGLRALYDYQQKHSIIKNLSCFFTTGIENLENKIIQLSQKQKELSKLYNKMEQKMIEEETLKLKENNLKKEQDFFFISKLFIEKNVQSIKQIAFLLGKEEKTIVILAAKKPEPTLCIACSVDLKINIKEILNQLLAEFKGKGGGSDLLVMMEIAKESDIENAYQRACIFLNPAYRNKI